MQSLNDFITARQRAAAILDSVRLIPPERDKSRTRYCSPGWTLNLTKRQVHVMLCKRRLCEQCSWYWAWKWRKALKEKAINDDNFGKQIPDKALTLTFAENVPYVRVQKVLEDFWQLLRRAYPTIQYWGALEFNQKHTLPHLHFVLSGAPYIELDYLDYAWRQAQKQRHIEKIAWNLRIEKIRKNVEAYFTKYITKLTGGKDEIPRRENWGGRYIRYSLKFFPVPVAAMLAAAPFNLALARAETFDRFVFRVRQPRQDILWWYFDMVDEDKAVQKIRSKGWLPEKDIADGTPVPEPDLLDGISTIPVFHVKQADKIFYQKLEGFNYGSKTERLGPAF